LGRSNTSNYNEITMPKPVAGFNANPQNINKDGRPKKGYSITEWFKEMLNSKPEVKDAIGKSIMKKALEGDSAAQKLVWSYMDGMPPQNLNIGGQDGSAIIVKIEDYGTKDNSPTKTEKSPTGK
jgi:hypothetical protein